MTEPHSVIERVEAWHCRVPLETPLTLGDLLIDRRDFVVVRMQSSGGLDGVAYALSRGAPVDLVVTELLAPLLLGRNPFDIPRRVDELSRGLVALGPVGIVQRAISLIDICLWDIKAKAAGMPVWRLLGGYRDEAPVMLVAPYADANESDGAYAARLAELAKRGYVAIKLYPVADPRTMASRLEALRAVLGARIGLVVDMAWSWRTAKQAIDAVRMWEDFDLAWVEDPFPASAWPSIRALANAVRTPIGAGDEVSVQAVMDLLIAERAVDLVRLDATTIGGFSQFAAVRESASRAGYSTSPHAYPEIHRHCVFAWPGVGPIEMFPVGSPTWGASRFLGLETDLANDRTTIPAPIEPGLGLEVDWAAVSALSTRSTAVAR